MRLLLRSITQRQQTPPRNQNTPLHRMRTPCCPTLISSIRDISSANASIQVPSDTLTHSYHGFRSQHLWRSVVGPSLKLIPAFSTSSIAKMVRAAIGGYIVSNLLPGNLALLWVSLCQLANSFLEKSNLSSGQQHQDHYGTVDLHRCHPIQASLL